VPGVRRTAVSVPLTALLTALLASGLAAGAGGCGFVGAGGVSNTKPNGFVLRGYASTPVPAGDARPTGAACAAPTSLPDIAGGAAVKVLDPGGTVIALGTLQAGVINHSGTSTSCDFGFEIRAVPGGVPSYSIVVGTEPAHDFPAEQLRQDKPAIIPLAG